MATVELPQYELHVAGGSVPPADGAFYETIDPYTREPWARVPDAGDADVDRAVAAARAAFEGEWGELTGFERSRLMHRLADLIERDAGRLAELESRDSGKLLREFTGQMGAVAAWYRYFAGWADKIAGESIPSDKPNFVVFTRREPAGVVAAVVPWNSPLLLLSWKLAPALATSCTMVVKPSDHTPVTALELARLATEAGIPDGVVNVITGNGPAVGRALVRHPGVDKVAFTGSTRTGIDVAEGATSHLARVTLELGGKSAQLVFPDADLEAAANGVVAGVFAASGQTCMAGSRLIAHEDIHDELVELVAERARRIVLGNPLEPATEMGPLANGTQYATVTRILESALREGATAVCGGGPDPDLGGYFVQPTILTGVGADSAAVREEISVPSWRRCASPTRTRPSRSRTTASTGWPAPCGRSTSAARCASPHGCAPGRCGSTPTASSPPMCRSAASRPAASAARTVSTCSTSTPRRSRSGSRRRAPRATRSPLADGAPEAAD
jgi:(Z)-2-((N-methylformamido)methylene)-5-hydroxybutyrolactone dehydrogenase